MNTDMQTMRLETVQSEGGNRWVFAFSVGAVSLLFLMAVSIAGWTVNTAYQSAHWQKREQAALTRQKELAEALSSSRSLQAALQYAEAQGFVASGAIGSITTSQPVAQNVVVR
jgi:aryl-alcohol dehydrogenase-like predicted oxidoreductase